ncbi:hypothetical protein F4775DRAFT_606896 [Biscogniauxia sp. FL1348]|nr:hypothetical protein F4775DRAFT_606896 [Biscogniauxia sp. FL1348]
MDNPCALTLTPTSTTDLEHALHRRRARRAARLRSAVGSSSTSHKSPPLAGCTRRHTMALARAYRAARTRTCSPPPVEGKEEERYCFAVAPVVGSGEGEGEGFGEMKQERGKERRETPFERAMARVRALVADGTQLPPRREDGRAGLGSRSRRGAGWHRRGYRDECGFMWINVKEGTYGPVRGREARERETMREFVEGVFDSHASSSTASDGGYADLLFRRKSLLRVLVDLENRGLPDEEALVCDYFDGGETVYFKAYDSEGVECSLH